MSKISVDKISTRNVEIVDSYEISPYSFTQEQGIDLQKLITGILICVLGFIFLGVSIQYQEEKYIKDKTLNYYIATIICLVIGASLIYKAYYDRYKLLGNLITK